MYQFTLSFSFCVIFALRILFYFQLWYGTVHSAGTITVHLVYLFYAGNNLILMDAVENHCWQAHNNECIVQYKYSKPLAQAITTLCTGIQYFRFYYHCCACSSAQNHSDKLIFANLKGLQYLQNKKNMNINL